MFRYKVQVETRDAHGESYWTETVISRLTALDQAGYARESARAKRKTPDAKSVEVRGITEWEFKAFHDYHNRHED